MYCKRCGLPMSLGPISNADENSGMEWYCDGPNDRTWLYGCGDTISEGYDCDNCLDGILVKACHQPK